MIDPRHEADVGPSPPDIRLVEGTAREWDVTQVYEPWVVVLSDPQTGGLESYGPYSRDEAERLRLWCSAELDVDGLGDVVVLAARMRS